MEDSKKVYKFFGRPGEDFHLWSARTEAALEAKGVLMMIESDLLSSGAMNEELKAKIATARVVIMQGLGDRPLRLCLGVKQDPYRMWMKLKDRYAVSNTATKVQLQTKLSKMSYKGEAMQDYVDEYEEIFNRLSAMESVIAEDLQVAMLLASFGDKKQSPYGHVIASLQTIQENLDWETTTATLIQEYEEHLLRTDSTSKSRVIDEGNALAAQNGRYRRKTYKRISSVETRRCFRCGRKGHIARHCRVKDSKWKSQSSLFSNSVRDVEPHVGKAQQAQLLLAKRDGTVEDNSVLSQDNSVESDIDRNTDQVSHDSGHMCYWCLSTTHAYDQSLVGSPHIENSLYWQHYDCNDDFAATAHTKFLEESRKIFLLDSGASEHMVCCKEWLHNVRRINPRGIMLGNGHRVLATHEGTLDLRTFIGRPDDQYERIITLTGVLFLPDLSSNLLSCSRLCETGHRINFGRSGRCNGLLDGIIQFEGVSLRGVYRIKGIPILPNDAHACTAVRTPDRRNDREDDESSNDVPQASDPRMKLWHARLGHSHIDSISKLWRSGAASGFVSKNSQCRSGLCVGCMKGKQRKQTLRTNRSRTNERCATIHTDVCGPMSVVSFSGARYFVSFIDEASGYITIVPIPRKSDVLPQFKLYQAWLERKHDCTIKRVNSDGGGEYVGMKDYLSAQGIEHSMSPPYSPNQNAIAERTNRTIVECARSMLEHASLPRRFWAEAVVHCAKVRNLFFCPRDPTQTSYQKMTGRKPDVAFLRIFGCLGWYHIPKDLRKKLDAKSELGIVIGCLENSLYKLWIPSRNTAIITRDVTVVEDQFPACDWNKEREDTAPILNDEVSSKIVNRTSRHNPTPTPGRQDADFHEETRSDHQDGVVDQEPEASLTTDQLESITHYPEPTGNGIERNGNHPQGEINSREAGTQREARYPIRQRRPPDFFIPDSAQTASALSGVVIDPDPLTVEEALHHTDAAQWKTAICSELESLKKHGTWDIINKPPNVKPLSTKFVFLRKFDEEGKVIRHKARLVVRGFLQGDVHATFAPVVDFAAVRTCLTLAVQRGYLIEQMDVRTAFLHGEIEEDVYVQSPEGLELCNPGQVLKLRRGLYGLKQAPKLWHEKWKIVMKDLGFHVLSSEACIFRRNNVWLLIYVDDIVIIARSHDEVRMVKHHLKTQLDVKDLGTLCTFLGVLFLRDPDGAWLSQAHYIRQVLKRFGMSDAKAVSTPMVESTMKDVVMVEAPAADLSMYQELLGCLLFIATRTRPDIMAATSILCRFASKPNQLHWKCLKRVLRYLSGTVGYALRIFREEQGVMSSYCDADWAGDHGDRKSTTGILLQLGKTSIVWRTLKQSAVALSTTEAEFMALSEGTKIVIWLRHLLSELGFDQSESTEVFEDNQGAIVWGSEGIRQAKHVSIRRNFVREHVEKGTISLLHCETSKMIADILTKPLSRILFERHRNGLGIHRM